MLAMEQRERSWALSIADLSTAKKLLRAHIDVEMRQRAAAEAHRRYRERGITRPMKNNGWSPVTIVLSGGLRLQMKTPTFVRAVRVLDTLCQLRPSTAAAGGRRPAREAVM